MPNNLVKTKKQEKKWKEAEKAAAKSLKKKVSDLKKDDYRLVNHIYGKMIGRDKNESFAERVRKHLLSETKKLKKKKKCKKKKK